MRAGGDLGLLLSVFVLVTPRATEVLVGSNRNIRAAEKNAAGRFLLSCVSLFS